MTPQVLNKHKHGIPDGAVYIGRPSKWGNPFTIGVDGTREDVIRKFKDYLFSSKQLMDSLTELKGKDLVCFCAPKACHGDILRYYANRS